MSDNEDKSKYIINVKTVQSGAFRVLIESLKEILTDTNITFDKEGIKKSEMYADTAIIYNKSDSVVAIGDVLVESIKGYKLYTNKIILYNDIKLVKSYDNIMFTSNNADTLYGIGFWSDFDMENSQILKPIGRIIEKSE